MPIPLKNAKDTLLNENSGTLPNMSGTLTQWLQPIDLGIVGKIVNGMFQVLETKTTINFRGAWINQPPQRLDIKSIGQRHWDFIDLYVESNMNYDLKVDDIVTRLGKQYRIMVANDWNLHGFKVFQLVEDYTNVGPL